MKAIANNSYPAGWIITSILLLCCATAARAQFTNGDFSLGVNGCNAGTGWTTSTGTIAPQRTETYQPGNPWIDLTHCNGWGNGSWMEQAVPVTVGNCYRIDFDLSSHCGWDGSRAGVYISIDGQQLGGWIYVDTIRCPPPLYWERKSSLTFVAQNNPTVVRFTGEGRCRDFRTGTYPCNGPGAIGNPGVIALDNIELVSVGGQTLQLSLGNDTLYCEPFTRTLDAGNAGSNTSYAWSTGDTTQTLAVSAGGTYWCTVTTMCGTATDTIRLTQGTTPQVNLGDTVEACTGEVVTLQSSGALPGGSRYTWSTSATTPAITVTQPGDYWLEADNNGCTMRDTVHVDYITLSVDLGADISLCDRDTPVMLHATQPAAYHYLWSNGLSDTQMTVSRSGRYWLEVSYHDCRASDSITVDVVPTPEVYIGADSIICEQFPHRIGQEIAGAAYRWNTGETTPYISVSSTGSYISEVTLRGCVVYDTVQITAMPTPVIDLGPDGDICPEQTILLDGTYGTGSSYVWNTGETTPVIPVTSEGVYWVHVTTEHRCTGSDSIKLSYYPRPEVRLQGDTTVCEETPLLLRPQQLHADSLLWSDGSVGDMLSVKYGGEYTVTAVNKCGTGADTIEVKQIFCDIWVPNAFTPNGDGSNDVFRTLGNLGRIEGFGLSVYNRWGQRIFYTRDKYQGWDGSYNGTPALLGTYVYMLEYSIGNTPYLQKGNFHLIR